MNWMIKMIHFQSKIKISVLSDLKILKDNSPSKTKSRKEDISDLLHLMVLEKQNQKLCKLKGKTNSQNYSWAKVKLDADADNKPEGNLLFVTMKQVESVENHNMPK